jgi:hypothetical protein
MTEIPIACTLSPDGLTARLALIDALAADGLLDRAKTPSGTRVRLRDEPHVEQRTRELMAAESRCCAFLTFQLGRDAGDLVLDISGPEDARPVMEMFFAVDPAGARHHCSGRALASGPASVSAASCPRSARAVADFDPGSAT